jgi:hypothetical protein
VTTLYGTCCSLRPFKKQPELVRASAPIDLCCSCQQVLIRDVVEPKVFQVDQAPGIAHFYTSPTSAHNDKGGYPVKLQRAQVCQLWLVLISLTFTGKVEPAFSLHIKVILMQGHGHVLGGHPHA